MPTTLSPIITSSMIVSTRKYNTLKIDITANGQACLNKKGIMFKDHVTGNILKDFCIKYAAVNKEIDSAAISANITEERPGSKDINPQTRGIFKIFENAHRKE